MSMEAGIENQKSSPDTMQALGESSAFPDVRNYIGGLKLTDEINRSTGLKGSTCISLSLDNTFLLHVPIVLKSKNQSIILFSISLV